MIRGMTTFSATILRRAGLWTGLLVGCVQWTLATTATAATVEAARVHVAPDHTRLVFDLSEPAVHRVFQLASPPRVVVDLDRSALDLDLDQVQLDGTAIRGMRSGVQDRRDLRIVLDLNAPVRPRSFLLKPNERYGDRLVIDLFTTTWESEPIKRAEEYLRERRPVVVAVDAGHGGEDPGALGPGHVREKDVVLSIARKLHQRLQREPGFHPVLIRTGDYYLALRKRTELAREAGADLFISLHADSFRHASARGGSVYILSSQGASSESARWLAQSENQADLVGGVDLEGKESVVAQVLLDLYVTSTLQQSHDVAATLLQGLGRVTRLHKRQVEKAQFVVLKSPDIPSLLVETGFISNPQEAAQLASARHQERLAGAIADAVIEYYRASPPPGTWLAWQRASESVGVKHQIAQGDTLSGIASKYQVSVHAIRELNGLSSDRIRIGQVLQIPTS